MLDWPRGFGGVKRIDKNGKVFFILDPRDIDSKDPNWGWWQQNLRWAAYHNQKSRCICGDFLGSMFHLHHAIVTKADVRGLSREIRPRVLHHSYNVIAIHNWHHHLQQRKESWAFLTDLYGVENVEAWYMSLPFKILPRWVGE